MTEVIVWSGWAGGLAVGAYGLVQLLLIGEPLGVSRGFGRLCGLAVPTPFFKQWYGPKENWRIWFLLGIPLGGLAAALTSPGELHASFSLGALYDSVLPAALWARGLWLAAGGVLMGFGARMAGGCTSGHSIGGLAMLGWPSAVASAGFFAGGIIAVQTLFRLLA